MGDERLKVSGSQSTTRNPKPKMRQLIPPKWHIIRRLYDWMLHWAHTPYGTPALAIVTFVECSFFGAPGDLMLVALGMGHRRRCFFYAFVAALFSVLGAMFGYFLGHEFFVPVSHLLAWTLGPDTWYGVFHAGANAKIVRFQDFDYNFYQYSRHSQYFHDTSVFLRIGSFYSSYAFFAVFMAAFLPLPFQVFTLSGGYFGISFVTLVVATALGRGSRFIILAALVYTFGPAVRRLIEKYFDLGTIILIALGILAFVLMRYVF